MCSVPTRVVLTADGSSLSSNSSLNSFHKDGRKLSLGDCALFNPPRDSPPFIGVIRSVKAGKENKFKLGVNWLYRPAEVKLGKGILLDAAPNELFYSFHKDEIPAASLLHPCKVAFLPKGAELPSGTSSFVCRRIYDIKNRRLWWLTDNNYINERQEVDQLLSKTQEEMHATIQSGRRSPKQTNGPTSTSQLKVGSENMQTSVTSFSSSQVRGKKRERSDQSAEPFKRERITKADDSDSGHLLKAEITRITEKGGLVDSEGVERLVQLMLPDRTEKKIDLARRLTLAGVVAATENFDCLDQFVQLRGLPVFDEWLQEVHKGKVGGDNGVPKDSDKSVEEFLLVLLRALDKLPVNLHALQMCNIGKSVNHLRSHKNSEIQKKSRSLVDTWKKRVEAEMNISDTKGASWPGKSRSDVGNRNSGGSSDVALKSSKSASVKIVHGDSATRSASVSPGSVKSASMNLKDGPLPRNTGSGMSDVPLTPARDEKSSGSSQSHNNSQSCSNDAGSMNVNKVSGCTGSSSRPRKSTNNGFQGSQALCQRKIPAAEKSSQSGLTSEKVLLLDGTTGEGNSHGKLIVKIPNRGGRSPAQNSGGSFEDPSSIMSSRASSPAPSKDKNDLPNLTPDVNAESWQSNDFKDVLTASDEGGDGSPAEERCRAGDDGTKKAMQVPKNLSSSTGNEQKSGSFSSMRALIASCVHHSESNGSVSVVDEVGMNLLASVAAAEITDSPSGSNPKVRDVVMNLSPPVDGTDGEHGKGSKVEDDKSVIMSEEKCVIENTAIVIPSITDSLKADPCEVSKRRANESISLSSSKTEGGKPISEKFAAAGKLNADADFEANRNRGNSCSRDGKIGNVCSSNEVKLTSIDGSSFFAAPETENKENCGRNEGTNDVIPSEEKVIAPVMHSEPNVDGEDLPLASESGKKLNEAMPETVDTKLVANGSEKQSTEPDSSAPSTPVHRGVEQQNVEAEETGNCGEPDSLKLSSSPPSVVRDIELKNSKCLEEEAEEECTSTSAAAVDNSSSNLEFDLNEGFNGDDGRYTELKNSVSLISPLPLPASVTVTAAAKGLFVPQNDLLRCRGELGWKGSAATSAFRPAEPRKQQKRPVLDFDLNVADEMALEDMAPRHEPNPAPSVVPERSSGGLDLDLNEAGEDASDMGNCPATTTTSVDRDFDLNDDPAAALFIHQARNSVPGLVRPNHVEPGSFSSPWFHPAPTYQAVPSTTPQRMVGTAISGNPFGPVLPASPALPFPSNSFQYPVFSYPTTTTTYLDSSSSGRLCFPGVQLGPAGGMSSGYPRPYVISIQDGAGGGGGTSKRTTRQGLDLNAGPTAPEIDGREEYSPLFQRQMPKRKEPDGGWDGYKQQQQQPPSWQ